MIYLDDKYINDENKYLNKYFEIINLNKIIFYMCLIKVFFEEEYDLILDREDISNYLNSVNENAIEREELDSLLVEKILEDVYDKNKILINEEDRIKRDMITKFINNNFINNSMDEEIAGEIETTDKKYIKIIDSTDKIKFENDYIKHIELLLHAIMSYRWQDGESIIEERFKRVIGYIFELEEEGELKIYEIINFIKWKNY
ncbi:hypothetical protein [Caloranaerobacter sp. DY30410]|uniref:hypothetical protein n=1 Tax=Caloranaerobacter sp. DY30410 TaxID=3238305 RepID=UPI003D087162